MHRIRTPTNHILGPTLSRHLWKRRPRIVVSAGLHTISYSNATNATATATIPPLTKSMVTLTKTSPSSDAPTVTLTTPSTTSTTQNNSNSTVVQDNTSILITERAIRQVRQLAPHKNPTDPSSVYLRLYVDSGGCSGFQYQFELTYEQPNQEDTLITEEDVVISASLQNGSMETKVVVDDKSLELLEGSTVDFVEEMIRSSFAVVDNPQSESACGCGSSFAVKNFEANPALD